MTHTPDGALLISDGTDKLYIIDPTDFSVKNTIPVTENGRKIYRINELELVNGKLYANVF